MFLVIESCKVEETVCLIKKSDANAHIAIKGTVSLYNQSDS